jgi:hypothetical protein
MAKMDPLTRKRQYVQSLTHSSRYLDDEDFLKPTPHKKAVSTLEDFDDQ